MAIEARGKSVPQFGSHPVEQKIEQQITTTEMKTTEMKLCPRQNLKVSPEESLSMMESRLKFRSCHPETLAGAFRRSSL
jgi:hypothetical protein